MKTTSSNLIAIVFGFFLTLFLLFAAEFVAGFLYKVPPAEQVQYPKNYFFYDANGITRGEPGRHEVKATSGRDQHLLYDVVYEIDQKNRRITPFDRAEERKKHMIFFGCSFTYGEGLHANETYPAQMASRALEYRPYNYGFHGHSPAEMLATLESGQLLRDIKEEEGMLIYLYIDAHILRVAGPMSIATTWGKNRPYYVLGKDHAPIRNGDFTTGRPVLSAIYNFLSKSKLLKLLKIDIPPKMSARDIELTARLIERSAHLYRQQFPKGRFVVALHPDSYQYGTQLKAYLEKFHIETYDYRGLFDASLPQYVIDPEDIHPNALANKELVAQMVKDLKAA
jgi:hypothetical protein